MGAITPEGCRFALLQLDMDSLSFRGTRWWVPEDAGKLSANSLALWRAADVKFRETGLCEAWFKFGDYKLALNWFKTCAAHTLHGNPGVLVAPRGFPLWQLGAAGGRENVETSTNVDSTTF